MDRLDLRLEHPSAMVDHTRLAPAGPSVRSGDVHLAESTASGGTVFDDGESCVKAVGGCAVRSLSQQTVANDGIGCVPELPLDMRHVGSGAKPRPEPVADGRSS